MLDKNDLDTRQVGMLSAFFLQLRKMPPFDESAKPYQIRDLKSSAVFREYLGVHFQQRTEIFKKNKQQLV